MFHLLCLRYGMLYLELPYDMSIETNPIERNQTYKQPEDISEYQSPKFLEFPYSNCRSHSLGANLDVLFTEP